MMNLYEALAKAQGEFPAIPKDKEVIKRGTSKKTGKEYEIKYLYASYDNIVKYTKPVLAKNGLSFSHSVEEGYCKTQVKHSSGEATTTAFPLLLPRIESYNEQIMQEFGRVTTYAKRYGLSMALGLSTDDDLDANDLNEEPEIKNRSKISTATKEDLSCFKMPFGKRKGESLGQIHPNEIDSAMDWAKSKNKFPDFVEAAELYLKFLDMQASDLVPNFNPDDQIPF